MLVYQNLWENTEFFCILTLGKFKDVMLDFKNLQWIFLNVFCDIL